MTTFNNKKGFTLVELLVVISIISLLSSIVLSSLSTARNKAQSSKVISQLLNIRNTGNLVYNGIDYSTGTETTANKCVSMTGNTAFATLMSNSSWPNNTMPDCYSDAAALGKIKAWSFWHSLPTGGGWCVDSIGNSKSAAATAPSAEVCP